MEEKYIERLVEVEQRSKSNTKRIDGIEAEVADNREMTIAVKEIANEMKHMREDMNNINSRLEQIEQKPAKNWEKIQQVIITRNRNGYFRIFFRKIRNIGGSGYE